jgi:Tfp pilus assembly protein PilX
MYREYARIRARRRKRDGGAVLFIVAVTLGLLAVMGIYGLSATSADVRATGHMREALQGQKAGEAALMMTAETFGPSRAEGLVAQATAGPGQGQSTNCKTASPYTGNSATKYAEACLRLDPSEMVTIANTVNRWVAEPFTTESFGRVTNQPFISVEVTNPVDIPVSMNNQDVYYTQLTVTVFVDVKPSAGVPAETSIVGRGRFTVGPRLGLPPVNFQ